MNLNFREILIEKTNNIIQIEKTKSGVLSPEIKIIIKEIIKIKTYIRFFLMLF